VIERYERAYDIASAMNGATATWTSLAGPCRHRSARPLRRDLARPEKPERRRHPRTRLGSRRNTSRAAGWFGRHT